MMFAPGTVRPTSMVNVTTYAPGARFGPRRMTDFELVWMLTGSAQWTVRHPVASGVHEAGHSTHARLEPGTVALGLRGTEDLYEWDAVRGSSHAWVHFDVDAAGERAMLERLEGRSMPPVRDLASIEPLPALTAYLLALARMGSEQSRRRSDEMVALFVDILLSGPFPDEASPAIPPLLRAALSTAKRAWAVDGHRILSLGELAAAAGVSAAHLSREFGRTFGVGLVGALELVRLGRAALALQRSNLSVEQVSRDAGFVSPYYFSRRFAAAYGQPPGRYRASKTVADPLVPLAEAGLIPVWSYLSQ